MENFDKNQFKFLLISIVFLISNTVLRAQINTNQPVVNGITGENPFIDASTNFNDANSVGKGLVFPNTDLTQWQFKTDGLDEITFPTAFDGMIVYNTGTGLTPAGQCTQVSVSRGFYYFSNPNATNSVINGVWKRLIQQGESSSSITASNGLTLTTTPSNDVKLGGTLSAATIINKDTNDLTISGTGKTVLDGPVYTTKYRAESANIIQADDMYIDVTTAGSVFTLPAATVSQKGRVLTFIDSTSGGGYRVDGGSGLDNGASGILRGGSISFICTGSAWKCINSN